ncbi:MAG: hypothetical protein ACN2B6_03490 [Rickettsiales bacterium]
MSYRTSIIAIIATCCFSSSAAFSAQNRDHMFEELIAEIDGTLIMSSDGSCSQLNGKSSNSSQPITGTGCNSLETMKCECTFDGDNYDDCASAADGSGGNVGCTCNSSGSFSCLPISRYKKPNKFGKGGLH